MNSVEWLLEALLVVLLSASLLHALRLGRALSALRRDRTRLEALLEGFNDSTRLAEESIERLRFAAEGAGRNLSRQVERASVLREDLNLLTERADKAADALERALRARRALDGATPPAISRASDGDRVHARDQVAPPVIEKPGAGEARVRSKAERDLLRALQMSR